MNDGDRRISIRDLAEPVAPGMAVPAKITFSPDGRSIAWLRSPERNTSRSLFLHNVDSGATRELTSPAPEVDESTLSHDEKLRRQRTRDLGHGVATYSWTKQNKIFVPTTHSIWQFDPATDDWSELLDLPAATIVDPQPSPNGMQVAWVQDGELMVCDLATNETRALTEHVEEGITHGLADYLTQEEMGRMHGYWWSPTGRNIAFTEVDERSVPVFNIAHTSEDPYDVEQHRYPFAGGPNPSTQLFVLDVASGQATALDIGESEYLTNVYWSGEDSVIAETMNRAQSELELTRIDIASGTRKPLLKESSDHWINLHKLFWSLSGGAFVWASERTGFMHLEVRNADGSLRNVVTEGEWVVKSICDVDEAADKIWFTANQRGPTQLHPFVASLKNGRAEPIAAEPGMHRVAFDSSRRYFIDLQDSVMHEPVLTLRDLNSHQVVKTLFKDMDPRVHALVLHSPELRTIEIPDGETLHASVLVPEGTGPFPTLVHVYGGPHAQMVLDTYLLTASLEAQYLRERGVCVVRIDNRGSEGRGVKFETPIHHAMGHIEVQDQVDALNVLIHDGIVDRNRVAISGASYGGYMAIMCLAQRPDVFKAAIGQALVSSWDGYDTFYTERYMGTPSNNVAGYENSSLMHHAHNIKGKLLLVHGMLDENVHFRHVARLVNALVKHAIPYQLLMYPDERHKPAGLKERAHMQQQMMDFLLHELEVSL